MYENVCYDNSFLKEVIVRVDFAAPITQLKNKIPPDVGKTALTIFPISEPKDAVSRDIEFSKASFRHTKEEFKEWHYYGREREKHLVIAQNTAFITYSKYSTYEVLKDEFGTILNSLSKVFPDQSVGRLGLRYINQISPEHADPFHWERYIDANLLGLFNRFTEQQHVTRLFNIAELKYDDLQCKFQFGVPNPDYPASIRRAIFILDMDGYIQGLQNFNEISQNLDRIHVQLQKFYEESITEELRRIMNVRRT